MFGTGPNPCARRLRMASVMPSPTGGLPSRTPFARAWASPSMVRSISNSLSNAAKAATIV